MNQPASVILALSSMQARKDHPPVLLLLFMSVLVSTCGPRYKPFTPLQDSFISLLLLFSICLYSSAHVRSFAHTLVLKKMLSFSKVITFAAVAFGTLSQAIPLTPREVGIGARASSPVHLKDLLTDLNTQLVVAIAPISTVV